MMLRHLGPRLRTRIGRQSLRHSLAKRLNPLLRRWGYTVIADHFYQPLPNPHEVLLYQDRERPLGSVVWDLPGQRDLVRALLAKYQGEFRSVLLRAYDPGTSGLLTGDAEVLYAMVREKRPRMVVEVGAGGSTLIIAAALERNHTEGGAKASLLSVDPYPPRALRDLVAGTRHALDFQLLERPVQSVDVGVCRGVEENDLVFVDSSHVFKQGSDVEFEFLQVYPALQRGVLVHIHDIFFPFDYPAAWSAVESWFWNEQYFLETFLQFNNKFRVVASLALIAHHDRGVFAETLPGFPEKARPASFWMEAIR